MELGVRGVEDGAPPCFVGPGSPFLLTRENQSGREGGEEKEEGGAAFEGHRIVGGWGGVGPCATSPVTFLPS